VTPYYPFDPDPRAPSRTPPWNSCDSQFHVFGPREKYPVRPGAAYEMPSATIAAALTMHRMLGIERGVIVQTTTYGGDHGALLDGLAFAGRGYRGCANAMVFATASDAYLAKLHAAGVRGARFSFRADLGAVLSAQDFSRAVARAAELGWYVKIQPGRGGIVESVEWFENLEVPVLIDHMGRPDVTQGAAGPNLRKILELLGRGNFWVMLSLGEKLSRSGPPWSDVVPLARAYIEAAPDRVVWGTDWPHPVSTTQPPNDAQLLELLYRYGSEDELQKILVTNPAALFGFDAT
jgi:2-pyrone-4,6-dicarboxylate lactonase